MRNLNKYFENKKIEYNKLIKYGFIKEKEKYIYQQKIVNNSFKIIDIANNEEYILADIKSSRGSFVGQVKEEYENIINDVIKKCTTPNVFKTKQAKAIIKYIKDKYNDDLEYLWEKFSNDAIWRNKENNKWYGLILKIEKNKLKLNSNEVIEIIDLRYQKEEISKIIDNKKIFGGYHMNKKSWITIKLDNSISNEEIYKLIDNSYNLSLKK